MLYVITGVRGAGKTTLIENIKRADLGLVLQPSTTRPKRFDTETEYDFVSSWEANRYAWSIAVGEHIYGMRLSEIDKASGANVFTVFEPIAIDTFYQFRKQSGIQALTIGLNTVVDIDEQHLRVASSASRAMTAEQFELAIRRVREADIVVEGNETEVLKKIESLTS